MAFLNTYDDTADDTFTLTYTAGAGASGPSVDTTIGNIRQGIWEVVFTCSNVTTVGSTEFIGSFSILEEWWQHVSGTNVWQDDGPRELMRFYSNDTMYVSDGGLMTVVSGLTYTMRLFSGLPPTLLLRSDYTLYRSGFTIGAEGTWQSGD